MSFRPLTDVELCFGCSESTQAADILKRGYQKLRGAYEAALEAEEALSQALRVAEVVRDDARAASQRYLDELRERRMDDLTDDEEAALTTARDVVHDSDILQWEDVAERDRALAALDRILGKEVA